MSFLLSNHFRKRSIRTFNNTASTRYGDISYSRLGRFYEEKCALLLGKVFEVPVELVGGANDGGIDLTWSRALAAINKVPFIGQCKHKQGKFGPEVARALEGSLSSKSDGTVGCLITNNNPTPGTFDVFSRSRYPMMFFKISGCDKNCTAINLILCNESFKKVYPNVVVVQIRGSVLPQYTLRFK